MLLALGVVAPVSATELPSDDDLAVLADEVERDPSLMGRLREVTSVEGRPVDLELPLEIDDGEHRSARLSELKKAESTPSFDADEVRAAAQEILDNEPFVDPNPNVFQRLLRRIDDAYQSVIGAIADFIRSVFDALGDGVSSLGLPRPGTRFGWAFSIIVLSTALVAAFRLLRFRQRGEQATADEEMAGGSLLPGVNADPDDYERRAEAAEGAGDLAEALRLWFAVGILRLHRAKRIRYRSTTTMSDLRMQVNDPTFDRVASVFEWSVYGGYVPAPSDLARFRDDWALLLEPSRSSS